MGTWREMRRRKKQQFEANFHFDLYGKFLNKFKNAYAETGLIFHPDIWYDEETQEAHPLTALAFSISQDKSKFMSFSGTFFNPQAVYNYLYDHFDKNFAWFDGLYRGMFAYERKEKRQDNWYWGYGVGREVRRQLMDFYSKKH